MIAVKEGRLGRYRNKQCIATNKVLKQTVKMKENNCQKLSAIEIRAFEGTLVSRTERLQTFWSSFGLMWDDWNSPWDTGIRKGVFKCFT